MAYDPFLLAAFELPMNFIVIVIVGLAFTAIAAAVGTVQKKRAVAAWTSVADQLGLKYHNRGFWKSPRITGSLHGLEVMVDTYTTRSGKNRSTFTRVNIYYDSLGLGLDLKREGFLLSVTKLFGFSTDIEVGDPSFDAAVIVNARDVEALRSFLTPARKMRILRFLNNYPRATISDTTVLNTLNGTLRNARQLKQMITAGVSVAWHLTGQREVDANLDRALHAQEEGHTAEALEIIRSSSRERRAGEPVIAELVPEQAVQAELIEERLVEGELLTLGGKTDEAHRVFQEARQLAPYDEELAEWAEQPTTGPKSDVIEADPHVAEPIPEPTKPHIAADVLCRELFEGTSTSYQVSHTFDREYAGTAVRWSGKLKRVETYSYDFVFGNEPGCRAAVIVYELETATYGDRTVSAIVQLPAEAYESLRGQQGNELTFAGKLHKVDALLRNIYVSEAKVVE